MFTVHNLAQGLLGGRLGPMELLLLLAIALLFFGPSKLSHIGKGLGEGIKNFKEALKDGHGGSTDQSNTPAEKK